ncbi:182 kDa tankyrase-1-binding protein isoform X3 [Hemicordylus capensis]|uniref:182 kDa tankyrase-1-binding protein isoform X3 n=1 Tax=Hemicordylus capensis TaxID=884348 RepID=UPI0023028BEE|nr:182 kDa tankyrase-1-binding protein isoform X3 [Hemicordylus capensis]
MNMYHSGRGEPGLALNVMNTHLGKAVDFQARAWDMLSSESQSGDVMDSKQQSLCSPFPCTATNGRRGPKQPSSSPETGATRPKPPVKPKPCVLPKPVMPVKAALGLRPALSEVPSAEKINLLAGPKPYSSGAGNAVKRLSFSLKCPSRETNNGKEASPPFSTAAKPSGDGGGAGPAKNSSAREECGESSSVHKGSVPFKVKPVPVVTKLERFPGTTVEEILAKIEKPNKEGLTSPDRPRLVRSFFSQDGGTAVHLGPKGYAPFRRCSSGGEGGETELESPLHMGSHETEESRWLRNKEETTSSNGQHVTESEQLARSTEKDLDFLCRDSSSQRSMSCDGGQPGHSSPQSPPGVFVPQTYQPLAKLSSGVTPGSPDGPTQPAQPPGAPYLPADVPSTKAHLPPGSPDAPSESLRSPVLVSLDLAQTPGSPVAFLAPCPPGSPCTSITTSPGHSSFPRPSPAARKPKVCPFSGPSANLAHAAPTEHNLELSSCLLGVSESPGSPSTLSEYLLGSDQPPGSPSHTQDSPLLSRDQDPIKNHSQIFPPEDKGLQLVFLQRASEGVMQPRGKKVVREELGGSLAVLPKGGDHPLEQNTGGESSWSLSQSFEWSFHDRTREWGGRRLGSPPRSPIKEAEDTELSGESTSPKVAEESPSISYEERGSEGLSRQGEEGESNGNSGFLGDSSNFLSSGKKVEEQPETPSTLGMSAPGGPSSPQLKGPIVATEASLQEHDGLLPFVPTHEEGALRAMEPLPSIEQAAPPAQPCILFLEDAQMQIAASCQEGNGALGMAKEGKMGDADSLREVEIEPVPGSCWLDELLASPPPSAEDTKRRGTPKSENPTGPEDLLGWSKKDLCVEFGIVGASQSETFGMGWSDASGVVKAQWPVETEQDREFGIGKPDWPSSYAVGDANRQDMEFSASQQDWTRGVQLPDNSNSGQKEWLSGYGSSCAGQQIQESDWSSQYDIDTAESQDRQPYARKPGWPKLCSTDDVDQGSSEFAAEKTDWSSQFHVGPAEKTDWPSKYSVEDISCPEFEVKTKSTEESNKYSTASSQDTQFSIVHSEEPDDCSAKEDDTLRTRQLDCPSESSASGSANQVPTGLSAQQFEQPSEYSAIKSPVNQQQPRPNTYGFGDVSCKESEPSIKQSDWLSRYDLGVAHHQDDEFSAEKPDGASEYDDSQTDWAREPGTGNRGSSTKFETGDLEFFALKPVWTDEYSLSETKAQDSDFPASTRAWAKNIGVSGTELKNQFGTTGNDQAGSFGSLGLPGLNMTIDLVETPGSLLDQAGDLRTVVMDEPRGVGEGQPDWTQDLGLGGMDLSNDSKFRSPDASRKPTEKQPDWFPPLGSESLSAMSDTRPLNPEESREPGVGQADLPYRPDIESMDASNLSPRGLDGAMEADLLQVDWTGKSGLEHKDYSYCFEAPGLDGNEMQHPGGSEDLGESRDSYNQRLSSSSHLLEEIVANSAVREVPQLKRLASSHSCHLEDEGLSGLPDDHLPSAEKAKASPLLAEVDGKVCSNGDDRVSHLDSGNGSQLPVEGRLLGYPEQNGSQAARPISQEGSTTEGAGAPAGEGFIFLEDTDVLDSTMYRDRANLGRKRGHRAPVTRSGGALSESDRDSWMFIDSTEPQIASAASDEEAPEDTRSRKPWISPLVKGVKVPLFPGLNPLVLKAKLRGRNRSAEEADSQSEAKQTPTKEGHVQRSKSFKIASVGGKPLVLPPKPDKSSGSETSSPNWLQVLKLKKKKF